VMAGAAGAAGAALAIYTLGPARRFVELGPQR
jgi:hypothetical protein